MIRRLHIQNFKNLRHVDVPLGNLNVLIGSNASGKSNFLEALRVLQGLALGLTVAEVFDGKSSNQTSIRWPGIRGGFDALRPFDASFDLVETEFRVDIGLGDSGSASYRCAIWNQEARLRYEELIIRSADGKERRLFQSVGDPESGDPWSQVAYQAQPKHRTKHLRFDSASSVLTQLPRHKEFRDEHRLLLERVTQSLADQQHLNPDPDVLRQYAPPRAIPRLGDRGENFAALVHALEADAVTKSAVLSWLKELRPDEVSDALTLEGAVKDRMFAIKERDGGPVVGAPLLSDGTLRFAALVLAYFQPSMPSLLSIEEVENGLHPARMRLLMELLQSQSEQTGTQTLVTTHAPWLLNWVRPQDLNYVLWFKREDDGSTRVVPLGEQPRVRELLQSGELLGNLAAEDWLEDTL